MSGALPSFLTGEAAETEEERRRRQVQVDQRRADQIQRIDRGRVETSAASAPETKSSLR